MNQEIRDVSPVEGDEDISVSPGNSQPSLPDSKKPKKSWIDKLGDVFRNDPEIAEMKTEKERIKQEAAQRQTDLDRQIALKESELSTAVRERDPAVIAERKRFADLYKAETLESRRLAKMIELADEGIRRRPPDERLVEWCRNQLGRTHMFGGIFSSPPPKE